MHDLQAYDYFQDEDSVVEVGDILGAHLFSPGEFSTTVHMATVCTPACMTGPTVPLLIIHGTCNRSRPCHARYHLQVLDAIPSDDMIMKVLGSAPCSIQQQLRGMHSLSQSRLGMAALARIPSLANFYSGVPQGPSASAEHGGSEDQVALTLFVYTNTTQPLATDSAEENSSSSSLAEQDNEADEHLPEEFLNTQMWLRRVGPPDMDAPEVPDQDVYVLDTSMHRRVFEVHSTSGVVACRLLASVSRLQDGQLVELPSIFGSSRRVGQLVELPNFCCLWLENCELNLPGVYFFGAPNLARRECANYTAPLRPNKTVQARIVTHRC